MDRSTQTQYLMPCRNANPATAAVHVMIIMIIIIMVSIIVLREVQ